jgi:membrane protein DedA with SNARE-associated domain
VQEITELLIQLIQNYGVLAVVLGMMLEEIVMPIPSPIVPMSAGVLLVTADTFLEGIAQIIFLIVIPGSIASVLASYFGYSIGYLGGKPVIERYGRFLDLEWEEIQELRDHMTSGREHYYIALFRAIPVVPLSLIDGASGVFRVEWKKYGVWSLMGMIFRNFTLAFIGWRLQDDFRAVAAGIDTVSTLVLVVVGVTVLLWLVERNAGKVYRRIFDQVG